jgi:alpha-tubulin suppressor-like RCC1 family protein
MGALALLSCPIVQTGGGGSLTVLLPGASRDSGAVGSGAERAVSDAQAATFRYELTFTGPGGAVVKKTVSPGASRAVAVTLEEGDWDINATAYTSKNILAGKADTQQVTVSAGENGAVGLTLKAQVIAIAAGNSSMILKADGSVWAAGYNIWGQLGNGNTTNSSTFIQVIPSGVVAIAAGGGYSLILKTDGSVWATGRNYSGELGDGNAPTDSSTFVQAKDDTSAFITGAISIAAGSNNNKVLKADGSVWATGGNADGELGDGTTTDGHSFVQAKDDTSAFITAAISIAVGRNHSLILKTDGSVRAAGYNYYGQLGDGTTTNRYSFVQVKDDTSVYINGAISIAAGGNHSLILKTDGSVWAAGDNGYGQLGIGTSDASPHPNFAQVVPSGVIDIATGTSHSLILKTDGSVWAAGDNFWGQLGNGTTTGSTSFIQVLP